MPWGSAAETDHGWRVDAGSAVKDYTAGVAEDLGGMTGMYSSGGWLQASWGDALDLLAFPRMEVFRRLLTGDPEKFDEALVHALESHKRYHTIRGEPPSKVDGTVPLGLLALACLAYDKARRSSGFSLDVESEYPPEHLVRRSWYGEFPV